MTDEQFEQFQVFLPKYLSPADKYELFEGLRQFPFKQNFYLNTPPAPLLQGDGWRGFLAVNFETKQAKTVSGLVVSNSCDIEIENPRAAEMRVLFAPLIRLSRYAEMLAYAGRSSSQIESTLSTIREQKVTYLLYLPRLEGMIEDSVVAFDDIRPHPLRDFVDRERSRLFTLSQLGFYILLVKLSIHFCRSMEGVRRLPTASQEQ